MREDDPRPTRSPAHEIGSDLSAVSVEELGLRVALLEAEIARLRQEIERKRLSRAAAGAFFKT